MKLSEIVAKIGGQLQGADKDVLRLAPLESADASAIAFLSNPKYHQQLLDTQAAAVIVHTKVEDTATQVSVIRTKDPNLYLAQQTW